MTETKDTAGVIAPPPLIFLGGLLIGGLLGWLYPVARFPKVIGYVFGSFLVVAGLALIFTAKLRMDRAKTNIEPWKPTNAIISDGIYGVSRNPIYLALILIYIGGVFLGSIIWGLPLLIVVLLVIHFGVILREEKYLEKKFGAEYLNYKERVRRWI